MKRILITGASGDLGRPLSQLAAREADVVGTFLTHAHIGGGRAAQIDLTEQDAVFELIENVRPDVIIHTAVSDRGPTAAIPRAARNVAGAAQEMDIRLITLSTDMIFDGTAPSYSERSLPSPISDYGRAKAESEAACLDLHTNSVIVRTSLIYDFDTDNRQISWMLNRILDNDRVPLFIDEIRSPVYVWNLAAALLELAASNFTGTLNIAGPEPLSRYEYGVHLLHALGFEADHHVDQVRAAEVAPHRPRNLTLDISLAQSVLRTNLVSLSQASGVHAASTGAT
jgi:dTDP-4-dehydrorhamnose reductase